MVMSAKESADWRFKTIFEQMAERVKILIPELTCFSGIAVCNYSLCFMKAFPVEVVNEIAVVKILPFFDRLEPVRMWKTSM